MLYLYQTNDLNLLFDSFEKKILDDPPQDPFKKEYVVVQTSGMRRWLTLEGTRRLGVMGQVEFLNPTKFLTRIEFLLTDQPETRSIYEKFILKWVVNRIFLENLNQDAFRMIRKYLGKDDPSKLFRLSLKMADLFDQYLIYRPKMLEAWSRGQRQFPNNPYEEWQMALWREIRRLFPKEQSRVDVIGQLYRTLEEYEDRLSRYLTRVSLFGMSVLPPYYFEVLSKLAEKIDVHFFMLNPCQKEYWGELFSDKREKALKKKFLHSEEKSSNAFLSNFGKIGSEFFDLIYEQNPVEQTLPQKEISRNSLLSFIQSGIFNFEDPVSKIKISEEDRSLHIDICHSPLREVEVLFDRLVEAFERDPSLTPADILVVTPDMETYAPYIDQVFGTTHRDEPKIPYSISDHSFMRFDSFANTVKLILDLMKSRFGKEEVLSLFEEVVQVRSFKKVETMEKIKKWVKESGIYWGLDSDFRREKGMPETEEYSWNKGIRRMLLGYALEKTRENTLYRGELPYDEIEGEDAQILGIFVSFYRQIADFYRFSLQKHFFQEWILRFKDLICALFEVEPDTGDESILKIFASFGRISEGMKRAGFEQKVPFSVFKEVVFTELEEIPSENTFFTGRVSFASMVPMRSIPFRVVALLGMNHGIFPRRKDQTKFNLMNLNPQKGDRDLTNSDRYLFLELLLSASDSFLIFYSGRDIQNNAEKPPSSAVIFLSEYIESHFECEHSKKGILDLVQTLNPLQPFSSRYGEGSLITYHKHWFQDSRRHSSVLPFHWDPIKIETNPNVIDGNEIEKILKNPPSAFLRKSLLTRFPQVPSEEEQREPFETNILNLYFIEEAILKDEITQKTKLTDVLIRQLRASGELPVKSIFDYDKKRAEFDVKKILFLFQNQESFSLHSSGDERKIEYEVGDYRFFYHCPEFFSDQPFRRAVFLKPVKLKGKHRLSLWIAHLFFNLTNEVETTLYCKDEKETFKAISSEEAVQKLLYLKKLSDQMLSQPIPFEPDISWEYLNANDESKKKKAVKRLFSDEDSFILLNLDWERDFFYSDWSDFELESFGNVSQKIFKALIECRVEKK